jgi:putative oxidoreductase
MMGGLLHTIAIILLLCVYIWSGVFFKVRNFSAVAHEVAQRGLPCPALCVVAAIALEIGGSVVLLLPRAWIHPHFRVSIIGCFIFYTLIAASLFHAFWSAGPAEKVSQTAHFLKNIGLVGAFILIACE